MNICYDQSARLRHENVTLDVSTDAEDISWDVFVLSSQTGHHEQTSLWARVKAAYGWKPIRVVAKDGGWIRGGVQALVRRAGRFGAVAFVSRGPVIPAGSEYLSNSIMEKLHSVLAGHRTFYVAVVPPYSGIDCLPYLYQTGYTALPSAVPPTGIMTATSIVDLEPELDVVFRQMRKKTRQHIKKGIGCGVSVREGSAADIATFRRLFLALCNRRHTSPTPSHEDFFDNLWDVFAPHGLVKLFLAEYAGRSICANVVFAYGDSVKAWKIGWSGEDEHCFPNEVLYWEMIKWAKEHGFRYFDLMSINSVAARRILSLDNPEYGELDGMSFFKIGFGGRAILLPDPQWYCLNPVLRSFIRLGGEKLLTVRSPLGRIIIAAFGRSERGE